MLEIMEKIIAGLIAIVQNYKATGWWETGGQGLFYYLK
jgi:hypothetical protein